MGERELAAWRAGAEAMRAAIAAQEANRLSDEPAWASLVHYRILSTPVPDPSIAATPVEEA